MDEPVAAAGPPATGGEASRPTHRWRAPAILAAAVWLAVFCGTLFVLATPGFLSRSNVIEYRLTKAFTPGDTAEGRMVLNFRSPDPVRLTMRVHKGDLVLFAEEAQGSSGVAYWNGQWKGKRVGDGVYQVEIAVDGHRSIWKSVRVVSDKWH